MKEQLKPSACWGQVLYDFSPQESTEIGVKQGEKVTIHNEVRGWLFVETKSGLFGYVPLKFCTVNGSAPKRDPMELKVSLSKQGHKINGVNYDNSNSIDDNRKQSSLNNNVRKLFQEPLDNAKSTDAFLKRAIATPVQISFARKSVINKDYCIDGTKTLTKEDEPILETTIQDISTDISETSESLSSLEETSSINSSQPDSVPPEDVIGLTPAAFLPLMLRKNPDFAQPDDSTTDSGFSMDEDNEYSDSERYKQILKRKAVDVIFKQNLNDALQTQNRCTFGASTKVPKQTTNSEILVRKVDPKVEPRFIPSLPGTVRPRAPEKAVPLSRDNTQESNKIADMPAQEICAETKELPRVPVVSKPSNNENQPQGSTFLTRFAVRRSSKELSKGKTGPPVARKPDGRRKPESTRLRNLPVRSRPSWGNRASEETSFSAMSQLGKGDRKWGSMECLLDRVSNGAKDSLLVSDKMDNIRANSGSVDCLIDSHNTSFVPRSESSSSVARRPCGPPDLRLNKDISIGEDNYCEKQEHVHENKGVEFVSIQTSQSKPRLVKSSQVLHTFQTWFDEENAERTRHDAVLTGSKSGNNDGKLKNMPFKDSLIEGMHSINSQIDPSVSKCACANSTPSPSCAETRDGSKLCSVEHDNVKSIQLIDTHESYYKDNQSLKFRPNDGTNSGANKFVKSSALENLDTRTSAYLDSDVVTSFKCENILSTASPIKKERNHVKIRRVQSMKETSSRKIEKRRVDWGPCVQVHYYDPNSEIDSQEDHVCRTTAMAFANTLEYEGSLV